MKILISIKGTYSDGQEFSISCDTIEKAKYELEMVEVNEHAFDEPFKEQ